MCVPTSGEKGFRPRGGCKRETTAVMPTRMAAIVSMIVFATCLVVGGLEADNPFDTVVLRSVQAMAIAFVVGLMAGKAALVMLQENVQAEERKLEAELPEPIKAPTETEKDPTITEVG